MRGTGQSLGLKLPRIYTDSFGHPHSSRTSEGPHPARPKATNIQRPRGNKWNNTYISRSVRPDRPEADGARAREAEQDEDAHDEVVPPRLLHGRVGEPRLLVLAAQTVALELVLAGRRLWEGVAGN